MFRSVLVPPFPAGTTYGAGTAGLLTSGRVPFVTTGGLLTDSANLTYSAGVLSLGGILDVTHATNGDNAAYLRNTHAAGYGPVFRGGGGSAGLYTAIFQQYDGTEAGRIDGSGVLAMVNGITCTTLAMAGALSGVTTIGASGLLTLSLNAGTAISLGHNGAGATSAIASSLGSLIRHQRYGFSSGYSAVQIGDASRGIGFGIDPNTVAGGQFSGDNRDFFMRRGSFFICPNAGVTDWECALGIMGGGATASQPIVKITSAGVSMGAGAADLLGSERLRVAGGTMGTPGATDVLVAAGRVYAGDTGATSIQTAGGVTVAGALTGVTAITDSTGRKVNASRYIMSTPVTGVNVNSAGTDVASFADLPAKYRVVFLQAYDASTSLTTATADLRTASGGGGSSTVSSTSLAACTTATALGTLSGNATYYTASTLYVRNVVAQGSAATVSFMLAIIEL